MEIIQNVVKCLKDHIKRKYLIIEKIEIENSWGVHPPLHYILSIGAI